LKFAQVSLFFPANQSVGITDVYNFRYAMLDAFKLAALPEPSEGYLFNDAWSTSGKITVSTDRASAEVSVTAVGGDFFSFHLMNVISGGCISDSDFMHDRIVIDRELAWLLYGGTDLVGLEVNVGGKPFIIAGVIDREYDDASTAAYTDGMGLYMFYDMYSQLEEGASINCYEVVMPEPYEGFADQTAEKSFACSGKVLVRNTGRFSFENIVAHTKSLDVRSVQSAPIGYPYWENAARITEDKCAFLLIAAAVMFTIAGITLVICIVKLIFTLMNTIKNKKAAKAKTPDKSLNATVKQKYEI